MTAPAAQPPRSMHAFYIIWLGQLISIIGSGLTSFGLAVWIYDQTGQATPFAFTVLFGSLPRLLLLPVAGAFVDRWNRRLIMIVTDTGSAVITLGAFFLISSGQLEVWHIYAIAICYSALSAFQEPAYTASVVMLVPREKLVRANGLIQTTQALEMLVAPLLAGVLFGAVGLRGIMLVDFITFFFAVGALVIVQIPQPRATQAAQPDGKETSIWQEVLFGWRYLRARSGLMGLLIFFALVNFFLNFSAVLLGPLVLAFTTATVLGLIQSFAGSGMLLGSIGISAWGGPERRMPAVIGFIALAAIGLIVAGLEPSPWFIAAGGFILMFSVPFGSGISQAVFQNKVAPDVQGRVFATRSMISRSMMPLAFLLAGPLSDRVFEPLLGAGGAWAGTFLGDLVGTGQGRGIGFLFMICGTVLLLLCVAAWANPRIRYLEDELPDALPESQPLTVASSTVAAEMETE